MNYKTIVVDDEKLARARITKLLEKYDFIEVIDEASNGIEAVEKIKKHKPDLIFLDIQMPGLTGFEVLQQLDEIPITVFVTAYDEYALKAFETNSLDYLLKPVEAERFDITVKKLEKLSNKDEVVSKLMSVLKDIPEEKIKRIKVKTGQEILFLDVENIYYFKSDEKYTAVHTFDENHIISETLSELEKGLPENFKRIHRSYIVNIDYLKKLKKWFGGKYIAVMKDKDESNLPVSLSYKSNIL